MKKNSLFESQKIRTTSLMFVAVSALILGLIYYALFRDHLFLAYVPGFLENRVVITQLLPIGYKMAWLPSFVHALATLLCVSLLLAKKHAAKKALVRTVVFAGLIGVELFFGTVDKFDIVAIVVAGILVELFALGIESKPQATREKSYFRTRTQHRFALLGIVSFSGLLAAGSYSGGYYQDCARFEGGTCVEYKRPASPVYMSYQRLREAVQVEAARPPDRLGRVYIYENYVLLNEQNEGIHIFDNTDPTQPINLGFIRIPGNTELAIRDSYLFANSYVDLITLDMNDPTNIQVVNRQENLFPYDAFQNIPYNVSFREFDINASLGVVVSYQLSGS
jgi:hypothetical protein